MVDVIALGEILIDFTPAGISENGNPVFERNPGGGPANVLAAIAKLGGNGAFIGKVGDDNFGHFLHSVLLKNNIEASGLKFSRGADTTLAFVHLDENGERSFSFYRRPGADTTLAVEDIDPDLIGDSKIFHFSSLSLTDEPARSATIKAVEMAKQKGKVISYDPNWRPPLWPDQEAARKGMELGLEYADILKVSDAELEFLTGERDIQIGAERLNARGIKLVIITLGPEGCYYKYGRGAGSVGAYEVKAVDTTGCGDAFTGALLYQVSRLEPPVWELEPKELENILRFSNAAGACCATKKGGIPAMPTHEDIANRMK